MRQKINRTLLLVAALVACAMLVTTTLVFYSLFRRQVRHDLLTDVELLKDTGVFDDPQEAAEIRQRLSTDIQELRITWIDTDGTVIYDNDNNESQLANHSDRPEIQQAFAEGSGESIRNSDTMKKNTFYYACLLDNGTVLRVSTEASSIWDLFWSALPLILLIGFGSVLVTVNMARWLTRFLMKPIEQLTEDIARSGLAGPQAQGIVTMPAADSRPMETETSYAELQPFLDTIRAQHEKILDAARSRQDFTANVSHELKTPLTAISGYAELMESGMVPAEQQLHFAEEIHKNADRLLSLINDIIRLSELDNGQTEFIREKADLYQLAKSQVEELQINAKARQVTLYFEGKTCIAKLNKEMVRELIDNLVQNAIRYNNPGGRVWVSVHRENGHPVVTVGDNGIGIPKDQQEHVFERFYRVDKSRSKATGGTGLGLAIVRHIVELHEAKIYLNSEPGKGTTIRVVF